MLKKHSIAIYTLGSWYRATLYKGVRSKLLYHYTIH